MKKNSVFAVAMGFAAGAAAVFAGKIAADKIVGEIKNDLSGHTFVSPDGSNFVTLSYGSSESAKGLTFIRVTAGASESEDNCKLVVFAKKSDELFSGEWDENDRFRLLIGTGRRKQCCDVTFGGEEITAHYYLLKE